MKLYSYVLPRDYGFAPNPFGEYCTLATCMTRIRRNAKVNDWVIGTGSADKRIRRGTELIYAMRVDEVITFNEYWNDSRFDYKKPVLNGSHAQRLGDNIYYFNKKTDQYTQVDSHHSKENGIRNEQNYKKDLSGKFVLISKHFFYFGFDSPTIPEEFRHLIHKNRNHKMFEDDPTIQLFIEFLYNNYTLGINGLPSIYQISNDD